TADRHPIAGPTGTFGAGTSGGGWPGSPTAVGGVLITAGGTRGPGFPADPSGTGAGARQVGQPYSSGVVGSGIPPESKQHLTGSRIVFFMQLSYSSMSQGSSSGTAAAFAARPIARSAVPHAVAKRPRYRVLRWEMWSVMFVLPVAAFSMRRRWSQGGLSVISDHRPRDRCKRNMSRSHGSRRSGPGGTIRSPDRGGRDVCTCAGPASQDCPDGR